MTMNMKCTCDLQYTLVVLSPLWFVKNFPLPYSHLILFATVGSPIPDIEWLHPKTETLK